MAQEERERAMNSQNRGEITRAARRALVAATAGWMLAGCAGVAPPAGPPPTAGTAGTAGTVAEWRTVNAYNGEPRATVRQRVDAAGARVEGIDFEEASEAPFGRDLARVRAWRLDARGDLVALERADGSETRFAPPLPMLPPRLEPGARAQAVALAREADGETPRRVRLAMRVAGWETVRVPAGEFRALRIYRDLDQGDGAPHRTATLRQEVLWYAPDAGLVVRREESSLFHDTSSGGGEAGGWLPRAGDWLRWELIRVSRP